MAAQIPRMNGDIEQLGEAWVQKYMYNAIPTPSELLVDQLRPHESMVHSQINSKSSMIVLIVFDAPKITRGAYMEYR